MMLTVSDEALNVDHESWDMLDEDRKDAFARPLMDLRHDLTVSPAISHWAESVRDHAIQDQGITVTLVPGLVMIQGRDPVRLPV